MSLQKHNHSDGQRNNSASIALNTVYIQQFLYRKAGLKFIRLKFYVFTKALPFLSTAKKKVHQFHRIQYIFNSFYEVYRKAGL